VAEKAGAQNAIGNTTNQLPHAEAEKEPRAQAIDAARAREFDVVFAQLEAEKGAAEAEVRATELVAYGGVIGLLVLVMVIASTRIQKTQGARPGRRPNSLKRHHLYQIR
jgi:hypothetical protein